MTTFLKMTDDSEGVQAPQESLPTTITTAAFSGSVNVNINIDVVGLIRLIADGIGNDSIDDRRAFVRSLLDRISSETNGEANVMIFNRRQSDQFNPNWATTTYGESDFKGILYGAWIFCGAETFVSEGEYGWENWGFYGVYDYDKPNKTVRFQQRQNCTKG
jgi:hypothetical protein